MCRMIYGCTCKGACNAGLFGFLFWGFNFTFFFFGAAMMGIGIYVLVDMPDLGQDSETMENVVIAVISVGTTIFLVGFLGCCAVTKDKSCYLTMYTILVSVVIVCQIALIFLAEFLVTVPGDMTERWKTQLEDYVPPPVGEDDREHSKKTVDHLQRFADCCGVDGPSDWVTSNPFFTPLIPVPTSCCRLTVDDPEHPDFDPDEIMECFSEVGTPANGETEFLRKQGCVAAWSDKLDYYSELVIITLAIFALCQVVGIVFACCLKSKIGKNKVENVGTVA